MALCARNDPRGAPMHNGDWDVRLDRLLQDLEGTGVKQQQTSNYAQKQHYQHQQQFVAFSSSSNQQQQTRHQEYHQQTEKQQNYPLGRSQSEGSLHESAGVMLKEMNTALKASTNYLETHRSVKSPEVSKEYHEYRSYSSGPDRNQDDFNLEQKVQHMIPLNSSNERSFGSLQSANMVSSVRQQKSFTTYKVQSNQYNSSGSVMVPVDYSDTNRPGSRLKQNIDELDTLLYDLNSAKGQPSTSSQHQNPRSQQSDYQANRSGGAASSDDYSLSDSGLQGHVKKTVSSFNEYTYQTQTSGEMYKKPPSPLPNKRRTPGSPGPSQPPVRRSSPGPSSGPGFGNKSSTYNYNFTSSSVTNGYGGSEHQQQRTTSPDYSDGPSYPATTTPHSPPEVIRSSPSPSRPRFASTPRDGTPSGVTYYNKYHSTQSHSSQRSNTGPLAFPTSPSSQSRSTHSPPKRVDELMSELADFDPSIRPSDIAEPTPSRPKRAVDLNRAELHNDDDHDFSRKYNSSGSNPAPAKPVKQASTAGPPVYYPPGEVFPSTKSKFENQTAPLTKQDPEPVMVEQSVADNGKSKASIRQEYGYKDKGRNQDSGSRGGAAVVPICLPLCCAAPCVIM